MTEEELPSAASRLADAALNECADARTAAEALVGAAGNLLTDALGIQGAGVLVYFAKGYHAVVTAHDDLRREQRGER